MQALTEHELRQSWGTPRELFAQLHREYGFTLDVCARSFNAKLDRYVAPSQDGLMVSWEGERVWCNPPYDNIEPWISRGFWYAHRRKAFSAFLVPVRSEMPWWHDFALRGLVHYFRGRIQFEPAPGIKGTQNSEASALVIFDGAHGDHDERAESVLLVPTILRDAKTGKLAYSAPREQLTLSAWEVRP